VSSCSRMLPSGVTPDEVFHDLIFLSQLIDMNESNATKFGRLRSVLRMNNITATVALQEVRSFPSRCDHTRVTAQYVTAPHTSPYKHLLSANCCYAMLCYAMLCYAMLCYAMLRYATLCYAMLRYADSRNN
jgi:hypothetical protein